MDYKALQGSTILAVDDNPNNLDILIKFFKNHNVDIRIATSGEVLHFLSLCRESLRGRQGGLPLRLSNRWKHKHMRDDCVWT